MSQEAKTAAITHSLHSVQYNYVCAQLDTYEYLVTMPTFITASPS